MSERQNVRMSEGGGKSLRDRHLTASCRARGNGEMGQLSFSCAVDPLCSNSPLLYRRSLRMSSNALKRSSVCYAAVADHGYLRLLFSLPSAHAGQEISHPASLRWFGLLSTR